MSGKGGREGKLCVCVCCVCCMLFSLAQNVEEGDSSQLGLPCLSYAQQKEACLGFNNNNNNNKKNTNKTQYRFS